MQKAILFIICIFFTTLVIGQTTIISGPVGSGAYGSFVKVLPNSNYVVSDPEFDEGGVTNIGVVYLYDGSTNTILSTIKGSSANDKVGSGGVYVLNNGNFVVCSPYWNYGSINEAGAVTWCSATNNTNIIVGATNSLVGKSNQDWIGKYNNVYTLPNGNFVVISINWDNGIYTNAGAATLCNGNGSTIGEVSLVNSLTSNFVNTYTGSGGIEILKNGNYVIISQDWSANKGAVTWCSGTQGTIGLISSINSLVGINNSDQVGVGTVRGLANGNYVVISQYWDNGSIYDVGAFTLCNGTIGTNGAISVTNSLIGNSPFDNVGRGGFKELPNGNLVVFSPDLSYYGLQYTGAVTWVNGVLGKKGYISSTNSLIGAGAGNSVGTGGITVLTDNNYVIKSPSWDNGSIMDVGAVTWADGNTDIVGNINSSNSLIGTTANDAIGGYGVCPLPAGKYVVASPFYDNGTIVDAGAATYCTTGGFVGSISTANSLIGQTAYDRVASKGIEAVGNGNYVVASPLWDNSTASNCGAATFCNANGLFGNISATNSLVGTKANDEVGKNGITVLINNNYVVSSPSWSTTTITGVGAVTWGNGNVGVVGAVASSNSFVGTKLYDNISNYGINALENGNYIINSNSWDNGTNADAGAITWAYGGSALTGSLSLSNSLVGAKANDRVGTEYIASLGNGFYIARSSAVDNGSIVDAQAITLLNNSGRLAGTISTCNSVLGNTSSVGYLPEAYLQYDYDAIKNNLIVGAPLENKLMIYNRAAINLAQHLETHTTFIAGQNKIPLVTNNCRILATINPNGSNPVLGNVISKVWIESVQPQDIGNQFVKRHYEITPLTSPTTATATITLYFTQQEFNDFNNISTMQLPANPNDAVGKANLLIEKRGGQTTNGTGLPNSYAGVIETINPDDNNIIWNAALSRWEISIDVVGFSGFFIKTMNATLPVQWLNLSGYLSSNNNAQLTWQVQEFNVANYIVERSIDGIIWTKVETLVSQGNGIFTYHYFDALKTENYSFYRIIKEGIDGSRSFSTVIKLFTNKKIGLQTYPNPIHNTVTISGDLKNTQASIFDENGKIMKQMKISSTTVVIDMTHFSTGIYLFKTSKGHIQKLIKVASD